MKKKSAVKRVLLLAVGCLLVASSSYAVPVLQCYLEGASYDIYSQTWIVGGGTTNGTVRLWVVGNTGTYGDIDNVHLSAAYDSAYSPEIVLTPVAGANRYGFSDWSTAVAPVTDGIEYSGVPIMDSGLPLPAHEVYGPGVSYQRFDLGNFALTDSEAADFDHTFPTADDFEGWCQINVYDVQITGEELPEDFLVHFDVYNHVAGDIRSVFAPFSHDAELIPEKFPPVPEPLSMLMLGCVGAGMFTARKLRRRK